MKKRLISVIALVVCCVLVFPMTVNAREYSVSGTDITINIDDTYWYVFTRDNIQNNSELTELGISYSDMYDILHNNKMYIDALLIYEDGEYIELGVRKTNIDGIVNFSNYTEEEILDIVEKLADKNNVKDYSLYETQYKYVKFDYTDSGYYICEYITVVNGDNYTLTFQATEPFIDAEYDEIEDIVNSVRFDVDETLEESSQTSFSEGLGDAFIRGAVTAAVLGGFSLLFGKKKKKDISTDDTSQTL